MGFFFPSVAISGGPADGTAHEAVFIPAKPVAAECWGEDCFDSCALERLVVIMRIMSLCLAQQRFANQYLFLSLCTNPTQLIQAKAVSLYLFCEKQKRIRAIWGKDRISEISSGKISGGILEMKGVFPLVHSPQKHKCGDYSEWQLAFRHLSLILRGLGKATAKKCVVKSTTS